MFHCYKMKWKVVAALGILLLVCCISVPVISVATTSTVPEEEHVKVPIVMYHSVLKDSSKDGTYVVSPSEFENDLVYLLENGYTTIFLQDLVDYVYRGNTPPEKPVVITFDDGYLNNLTYVLPILQKYQAKAEINIVGSYSQRFSETPDPKPNYAHLTWEDIKALRDSGCFEIGNHTYDMHRQTKRRGCAKNKGEDTESYQAALRADLTKTQELLRENCGITPTVFAYPYGYISEESIQVLKEMGFTVALTCYEKPNYITRNPEKLYALNRYNRPSGVSTEQFMKKLLAD